MSIAGALILFSAFCEGLAYYGIKTVLVLYIFSELDYSNDDSTILFHSFYMLVSTFSLVGGIVANIYFGKFKMISTMFLPYAIGCIVLMLGTVPTLNLPVVKTTLIGLGLIAIGAGCIRSCVPAFIGDQFELPTQAKTLAIVISLFYLAIFASSMLSAAFAPVLRADFHCFGDFGCFSLTFAVPFILLILAFWIFTGGREQYVINSPKFEKVTDANILCKIMLLYLPLSFFWALLEQQGSRWTLQATRMDGELWGHTIKPDQMQLSNHMFTLLFIPIINCFIYPILYLIGIRSPLPKIILGGFLIAFSFICAASLELKLEALDPEVPTRETGQIRIYNGDQCIVKLISAINTEFPEHLWLDPLTYYEKKGLRVQNLSSSDFHDITPRFVPSSDCPPDNNKRVVPGKAMSYFYANNKSFEFEDHAHKPKLGTPIVRPLINAPPEMHTLTLKDSNNLTITLAPYSTKAIKVASGNVTLFSNNSPLMNITAKSGGVYVLLGTIDPDDQEKFELKTIVIVEPNIIHIMWQLPQYMFLTAGEIMFTKSALEFLSTEAPKTIESPLQVYWLFTNAIGNMFVVVIVQQKFCNKQFLEYVYFAVIMLLVMLIFITLAICYICERTKKRPELIASSFPETEHQQPPLSEHQKSSHQQPTKSSFSKTLGSERAKSTSPAITHLPETMPTSTETSQKRSNKATSTQTFQARSNKATSTETSQTRSNKATSTETSHLSPSETTSPDTSPRQKTFKTHGALPTKLSSPANRRQENTKPGVRISKPPSPERSTRTLSPAASSSRPTGPHTTIMNIKTPGKELLLVSYAPKSSSRPSKSSSR